MRASWTTALRDSQLSHVTRSPAGNWRRCCITSRRTFRGEGRGGEGKGGGPPYVLELLCKAYNVHAEIIAKLNAKSTKEKDVALSISQLEQNIGYSVYTIL